jgi:hypothetical protein
MISLNRFSIAFYIQRSQTENACYNHFMEIHVRGSYFRMQLLGYMYPDAEGEPYDANWLLVRVDIAGPQGAWSVTDPCLLTHEVTRLADWLEMISKGGKSPPAISFLEPALLFRLVEREGAEKFLRIHFGSLVHPDWSGEVHTARENPDLWLDFPMEEADIELAVQELRAQSEKFPRRFER